MFRLIVLTSLVAACLAGVPHSRAVRTLPSPSIPVAGRIVGGEETTIDQVPYQVVFLFIDSYICGGSLIRLDVVLSAAHCMLTTAPSFYSFRAGSSLYASGGTVIGASSAIAHGSYVGEDFDFALFVLSSSFTASQNIGVIALPQQNQNVSDGALAQTSGWGTTTEGGSVSSVIRKVEIPIVNQEVCDAAYATLNYGVTENEICAGLFETGGQDACQGDSGGPLVVDGQIVGVTSWGYGCARAGYPGVWARVPAVVDWINESLA